MKVQEYCVCERVHRQQAQSTSHYSDSGVSGADPDAVRGVGTPFPSKMFCSNGYWRGHYTTGVDHSIVWFSKPEFPLIENTVSAPVDESFLPGTVLVRAKPNLHHNTSHYNQYTRSIGRQGQHQYDPSTVTISDRAPCGQGPILIDVYQGVTLTSGVMLSSNREVYPPVWRYSEVLPPSGVQTRCLAGSYSNELIVLSGAAV